MAYTKSVIAEVRLANAVMTSKSRLYPTKEGKWFKNDVEKKSFSEMVATFTPSSCESRNRPHYGIQELCHTLVLAVPHLRDGVAKGVYGPAVNALVTEIQSHHQALQQLNGAEKGVVRSRTTVKAAVEEVFDWLSKLAKNKKFRDLLPFLFVKSEIGKHVSNQLLEWTSATLDPAALAAAATQPDAQPAPKLLRKVAKKDSVEEALSAFKTYFVEVLAPASSTPTVPEPADDADTDTFAFLFDEDEDVKKEKPSSRKKGDKRKAAEIDSETEVLPPPRKRRGKRQQAAETPEMAAPTGGSDEEGADEE